MEAPRILLAISFSVIQFILNAKDAKKGLNE